MRQNTETRGRLHRATQLIFSLAIFIVIDKLNYMHHSLESVGIGVTLGCSRKISYRQASIMKHQDDKFEVNITVIELITIC